MKIIKTIALMGSFGIIASGSTLAVPLDITWNGGTPVAEIGDSPQLNPGFEDFIPLENVGQVAEFNLAGVTSIKMTWNAPAGYMYVVNPVPAGFDFTGLFFQAFYGSPDPSSSLGSVTASSLSVHTIYGTSPLSGGAFGNAGALEFSASADSGSGFTPFAFSSITISADFSGIGKSQTLGISSPYPGQIPFGVIYGGVTFGNPLPPIIGDPDLGSLLTLEPLPSGSAPEDTPTLTLAGLGFAGLFFAGWKQKRLPVHC